MSEVEEITKSPQEIVNQENLSEEQKEFFLKIFDILNKEKPSNTELYEFGDYLVYFIDNYSSLIINNILEKDFLDLYIKNGFEDLILINLDFFENPKEILEFLLKKDFEKTVNTINNNYDILEFFDKKTLDFYLKELENKKFYELIKKIEEKTKNNFGFYGTL